MNLENYVCTIEQAKKLDALMGKRESIFYWKKYSYESSIRIAYGNPTKYKKSAIDLECFYNAYTSQELFEIIQEHGKYSALWRAAELAEFLIYLLEGKDVER